MIKQDQRTLLNEELKNLYFNLIDKALNVEIEKDEINETEKNYILKNIIVNNKFLNKEQKELIDDGLRELLIYQIEFQINFKPEDILKYIELKNLLYDDNYIYTLGEKDGNNIYNYVIERLYDDLVSYIESFTK